MAQNLDRTSQDTSLLTPREREVAEAYAGGESYQQIAERLCLSPATIRTHLTTIYRKLNVSSKLDLLKQLEADKTGTATPLRSLPDKPSIAVLAFENMSGDPEQEFFSDGISEDIITALSRSPWLFIIARNTTFTYKGAKVDVKRIAEDLGVRYVLEGSVRRSGDRIRVTAQLIDGISGGHVWSERYDGQLEDVFDLQDEITRNVVASIQTSVHLTASPPAGRTKRPDLTVWEMTMRAWHLLYDFSPDSYDAADDLLKRALQRDPDSAEATLVSSLILHHRALLGFTEAFSETMQSAYELGRHATRLDARNEYAHWAHGISCWGLMKHEESIAALERAVELNPNCSLAYGSLGTVLGLVGRTDEAIKNQQIAIRSNPRDPSIFFRFSGMAMAHYRSGDYRAAVDWAARAIHRMPTWFVAHFLVIASHAKLDETAAATAAVERCLDTLPTARAEEVHRIPFNDPAATQAFQDTLIAAGLPR